MWKLHDVWISVSTCNVMLAHSRTRLCMSCGGSRITMAAPSSCRRAHSTLLRTTDCRTEVEMQQAPQVLQATPCHVLKWPSWYRPCKNKQRTNNGLWMSCLTAQKSIGFIIQLGGKCCIHYAVTLHLHWKNSMCVNIARLCTHHSILNSQGGNNLKNSKSLKDLSSHRISSWK